MSAWSTASGKPQLTYAERLRQAATQAASSSSGEQTGTSSGSTLQRGRPSAQLKSSIAPSGASSSAGTAAGAGGANGGHAASSGNASAADTSYQHALSSSYTAAPSPSSKSQAAPASSSGKALSTEVKGEASTSSSAAPAIGEVEGTSTSSSASTNASADPNASKPKAPPVNVWQVRKQQMEEQEKERARLRHAAEEEARKQRETAKGKESGKEPIRSSGPASSEQPNLASSSRGKSTLVNGTRADAGAFQTPVKKEKKMQGNKPQTPEAPRRRTSEAPLPAAPIEGGSNLKQGEATAPPPSILPSAPTRARLPNIPAWSQGAPRLGASHPTTPQSSSRSAASIASAASAPISGSGASDKETRPTSVASSPAGSAVNFPLSNAPPPPSISSAISPRSMMHPLPGPGDEPEDAWLRRIHMLNGGQNMPNLPDFGPPSNQLGLNTEGQGSDSSATAATSKAPPKLDAPPKGEKGKGEPTAQSSSVEQSVVASFASTPASPASSLQETASHASPRSTGQLPNGQASAAAVNSSPPANTGKGKGKAGKKQEASAPPSDASDWPSVVDAAKEQAEEQERRKSLASSKGHEERENVPVDTASSVVASAGNSNLQSTIEELQLKTSGQPMEKKGKQYVPLVPTIIHNTPAPSGSKGKQGSSGAQSRQRSSSGGKKKAEEETRVPRSRKSSTASHAKMEPSAKQKPAAGKKQGSSKEHAPQASETAEKIAPEPQAAQAEVPPIAHPAATIEVPSPNSAEPSEAPPTPNSNTTDSLTDSKSRTPAMPALVNAGPSTFSARGQGRGRGQVPRGRGSGRGIRGQPPNGPTYAPFPHNGSPQVYRDQGYQVGFSQYDKKGTSSSAYSSQVPPYYYNVPQAGWPGYSQYGFDPYAYGANYVPPESTLEMAPAGHVPDGPTHSLLAQIEFYFSQRNLQGDFFLRQCMDPEGWVPIQTVADFNRVKCLGADLQTVVETLLYSTVLDVDPEQMRVRKKFGWDTYVLSPGYSNGPQPMQQQGSYSGASEGFSAQPQRQGSMTSTSGTTGNGETNSTSHAETSLDSTAASSPPASKGSEKATEVEIGVGHS